MSSLELLPLDPSVEDAARDLYSEAFPENERIPFDILLSMTVDPACRFLWNMIRRIVPAITAAASGKADLSEVRSALEGEDRTFGLADAGGLVLLDVEYDDVDFNPHRSPTAERRLAGLRLRNSLDRRFLESL